MGVILVIHFNQPLLSLVTFYKNLTLCQHYECFFTSHWDVHEKENSMPTPDGLFSCKENKDIYFKRHGQQMHKCYAIVLNWMQNTHNKKQDILFFHDDVILLTPIKHIITAFQTRGSRAQVPHIFNKPTSKIFNIHAANTFQDAPWGVFNGWKYINNIRRGIKLMSQDDLDNINCKDPPMACYIYTVGGDVLWVPISVQLKVAKYLGFWHNIGVSYDIAIGMTLRTLTPEITTSSVSFNMLWGLDRANALTLAMRIFNTTSPYDFLHPVKMNNKKTTQKIISELYYTLH